MVRNKESITILFYWKLLYRVLISIYLYIRHNSKNLYHIYPVSYYIRSKNITNLNSDWDLPTSFFHAAQTLLTVGYGVPFENNNWSFFFSTFYIIWGTIVSGGLVGKVCDDLLNGLSPSSIFEFLVIHRDNKVFHHVKQLAWYNNIGIDILFYGYIIIGAILAFIVEEFDPVKSV